MIFSLSNTVCMSSVWAEFRLLFWIFHLIRGLCHMYWIVSCQCKHISNTMWPFVPRRMSVKVVEQWPEDLSPMSIHDNVENNCEKTLSDWIFGSDYIGIICSWRLALVWKSTVRSSLEQTWNPEKWSTTVRWSTECQVRSIGKSSLFFYQTHAHTDWSRKKVRSQSLRPRPN